MSRSTKTPSVYAIMNGTEDTTFIYGFISHSPTKYAYKELIKFRKRTSFMELLVYYLQKAMTEELIHDIRDFCVDTDDWLLRRNIAILGNRAVITKKPGGVVTVAGNQQLTGSLGEFEEKKGAKNSSSSIGNFTTFKKRKIKKYKLLIPLELKDEARIKLEDTQKGAIDKIFDIFPEMHDNWVRRKRLRRLLQEESTFKAQFYTIWALNEFSALMNRLNQPSADKIFSNDFIEPQYFLFDTNNCLLLSEENRYNMEIFKLDEGEKAELLPIPPTKGKPAAPQLSKRQSIMIQSKATKAKAAKTAASKNSKTSNKLSRSQQNKLSDVKDTSELIAESFYGLDIPDDDLDTKSSVVGLTNENLNKSQKTQSKSNSNTHPPPSRFTNTTNTSNFTVSPPSFKDIVDSIKKIFQKFNQAVVSVLFDINLI